MPAIQRRFGGRVRIELHDIDQTQEYLKLVDYEKQYGSLENKSFKVFVGARYLAGLELVPERLPPLVEEELEAGHETFMLPQEHRDESQSSPIPSPEPSREIRSRFMAFGLLAVAFAGLLDGINPCAFTTLVFFLSFLTYLGRTRKEILLVGSGFLAAMFVTYLALGLGAFHALRGLLVSHQASRMLALLTSFLALGLAVWSLRDYLAYRRTRDVHDVTLKLPDAIRAHINRVLRTRLGSPALLLGAASAGFLVTLLESVCTGQLYLPTIVFVLKDEQLRGRAFGCLLLYNLMFVLPLAILLVIGVWGVGSERLGRFLRAHLGAFKLAMAAGFALLAIGLWLS